MVDLLSRAAAARWLAEAVDGLTAVAFPSACLVCGASLTRPLFGPLCLDCWTGLPALAEAGCPRCGLAYPPDVPPGPCGRCLTGKRRFRLARAAGPYRGALKDLILHFKYRGRFRLARPLARLAFERCLEHGPLGAGAAVVPVPLHRRRRRERGYNQAELLARRLAASAGVPVARALAKVADRPPQAELTVEGRIRNAAGAYRARLPGWLRGRSLLLVDDVFTTGATAEACSRALQRAGAGSVDVITVSRVV